MLKLRIALRGVREISTLPVAVGAAPPRAEDPQGLRVLRRPLRRRRTTAVGRTRTLARLAAGAIVAPRGLRWATQLCNPANQLLLQSAQGGIRTRQEASANDAQGAQTPETLGPGARRRRARDKDASGTVTGVTAPEDPSGYLQLAAREGFKVQQPPGERDPNGRAQDR